jgi:hypothetical protein
MYNDKTLKSVAEAVKKVMEAELSAKQKAIAKIEHPKHKIDAGDLAALRAGKKPVKEGWDDMIKAAKEKKGPQPSGGAGKKAGHSYGGGKQKDDDKPVKEEASQEEFTAEIKKAQAKSQGKEKADVAKPKVVAVKQESVEQVNERELSEPEAKEKERLVKSMKKNLAGFKERYGERAKSVMYATATDRAKENK